MSQDYYGINGKMKCLNYTTNVWLGQLTLGLWDKAGIPRPMSNEDAKLVARMIRNYNKLQRVQYNYIDESDGVDTRQTREAMAYAFWTPKGYKQENFQTMHYNDELADFFDTCGGLMSEEEWFELHKDECDDDE